MWVLHLWLNSILFWNLTYILVHDFLIAETTYSLLKLYSHPSTNTNESSINLWYTYIHGQFSRRTLKKVWGNWVKANEDLDLARRGFGFQTWPPDSVESVLWFKYVYMCPTLYWGHLLLLAYIFSKWHRFCINNFWKTTQKFAEGTDSVSWKMWCLTQGQWQSRFPYMLMWWLALIVSLTAFRVT